MRSCCQYHVWLAICAVVDTVSTMCSWRYAQLLSVPCVIGDMRSCIVSTMCGWRYVQLLINDCQYHVWLAICAVADK